MRDVQGLGSRLMFGGRAQGSEHKMGMNQDLRFAASGVGI